MALYPGRLDDLSADLRLTRSAVRLLRWFLDAADWRTGRLVTNGRALAEEAGLSPNTAIRARRELVAAGVIAEDFAPGRSDGTVDVLVYGHLVRGTPVADPFDRCPQPVDNEGDRTPSETAEPRDVARTPAQERADDQRERPPLDVGVDPPNPPAAVVAEVEARSGVRLDSKGRSRVLPLVARALAAGWNPGALANELLKRDLSTARHPAGTLAHRLDHLPRPPARPAPLPASDPGERPPDEVGRRRAQQAREALKRRRSTWTS